MISTGHVQVNENVAKPRYLLQTGDRIQISLPPTPTNDTLAPAALELDILFEDEHLIAVNKPAGLTVHPGAGKQTTTLIEGLLHHAGKLASVGQPLRPGVVHRLDKETSGVIVVAKTDAAYHHLCKQFADRKTTKVYEAVVLGEVRGDQGVVNSPIARHPVHRKKMTSRTDRGRPAETSWTLIELLAGCSYLRIFPKTGRTHQIRVHLADAGHPIVGDKVYSATRRTQGLTKPAQDVVTGLARHALHALELTIEHPVSAKQMKLVAPLADDMNRLIDALRSLDV